MRFRRRRRTSCTLAVDRTHQPSAEHPSPPENLTIRPPTTPPASSPFAQPPLPGMIRSPMAANGNVEAVIRPRIGILGGGFDPPHRSHARIAGAAVDQLGLDKLLVIPCADHPTKDRALSPGGDRLALCSLAFAGLPRVIVDRIEVDRGGRSYTVETLRTLAEREKGPDGRAPELFLLVGSDNLAGLPRWREADALPDLAHLAVYPRAGHEVEVPVLGGSVPAHTVLACEPDDVNSTAIRAALRAGGDEAWVEELDPEVLELAVELGLYRDGPDPDGEPAGGGA